MACGKCARSERQRRSESAASKALAKLVAAKISDAKVQGLFPNDGILRRVSGIHEVDGENAFKFVVTRIPFFQIRGIGIAPRVEVRPLIVKGMKAAEERLQGNFGLIATSNDWGSGSGKVKSPFAVALCLQAKACRICSAENFSLHFFSELRPFTQRIHLPAPSLAQVEALASGLEFARNRPESVAIPP